MFIDFVCSPAQRQTIIQRKQQSDLQWRLTVEVENGKSS